jgi:hypothetical protein
LNRVGCTGTQRTWRSHKLIKNKSKARYKDRKQKQATIIWQKAERIEELNKRIFTEKEKTEKARA